jgi:hypothetical protein
VIDYHKDSGWVVTCDRCGHQVTIPSASIKLEQALRAVVTGQGWQFADRIALRKQGDDLCPECAASSREGQIRALEVRIAQLEQALRECGCSEVLEHGQVCYGCEQTGEELQDLEAELFYLRNGLDELDDPPLSCPQCGSEGQWSCLGEVIGPGGVSEWQFYCQACHFEGRYAGHPEAT